MKRDQNGRRGRRAGKKRQEGAGPFAFLEGKARRLCKQLGLYLLADGEGKNPRWQLFSEADGRQRLSYWPLKRQWFRGTQKGLCEGYRQAVSLALREG